MPEAREQALVAVLIVRNGKPTRIVQETARGIPRRSAKVFCRTFNDRHHGALRKQGIRAMLVAVE